MVRIIELPANTILEIEEFKVSVPAASEPEFDVSKPPFKERVPLVATSILFPPVVLTKPPSVIAASPSRSTDPAAVMEEVVSESVPDSRLTAPTELIAPVLILPALPEPVVMEMVSLPVPETKPTTADAPLVSIDKLEPLARDIEPVVN